MAKDYNYKEIIKQLSDAYSKDGRIGFDNKLSELKGIIDSYHFDIINQVVFLDFIDKTRIFGGFDYSIDGLEGKCKEEAKKKINIVAQQAS